MPEEGWKNVPVRNYLYVLLQKKAKAEGRSVTNCVERLLNEALGIEVPA
jgi:hypothetical protein